MIRSLSEAMAALQDATSFLEASRRNRGCEHTFTTDCGCGLCLAEGCLSDAVQQIHWWIAAQGESRRTGDDPREVQTVERRYGECEAQI